MPTMNKVDMMDCANGHHNYKNGGEHGDPCTVCGHIEGNKYFVNVAMSIRAYGSVAIYGETAEEARKLLTADYIAENFVPHGGGDDDLDYQHPSDIALDGSCHDAETDEDFQFEPMTIPDGDWINDPLGKTAPDMLAVLKAIIARIDGVWDDPNLMAMGPLFPSSSHDIKQWCADAIAKAEGQS